MTSASVRQRWKVKSTVLSNHALRAHARCGRNDRSATQSVRAEEVHSVLCRWLEICRTIELRVQGREESWERGNCSRLFALRRDLTSPVEWMGRRLDPESMSGFASLATKSARSPAFSKSRASQLRLKVNRKKSAVDRPWRRKFLVVRQHEK